MDTQLNQSRHGEEPNPLPSQVLDHEREKEDDTITFWKKGDSVEIQFSETESEAANFHPMTRDVTYSHFYRDFDSYDDATSSVGFSGGRELYSRANSSKLSRSKGAQLPFQNPTPYRLQSLSHFFTEEETHKMCRPDAVLSIEDNYFVVLPNAGTPGQTLFHCLSKVITGKERAHAKLREDVVGYICSQEGWDLLGHHIVAFYEPFIDEFQSDFGADNFGDVECDKIERRLYRHYFMDEEIEGSLIELVAASLLFGFSFVCIFLQEHDSGKVPCRVFNSFENGDGRRQVVQSSTKRLKSKQEEISKANIFLRVGDTPKDWRWVLAIPYLHDCSNDKADKRCQCTSISRGSYEAGLWNVYGLDWNKGLITSKKSSKGHFSWNQSSSVSVIPTSSGKLLGSYATFGKDLFSNLCCILPNCLHIGNRCFLKDVVSYCPTTASLNVSDPDTFSRIIMKSKDFKLRKRIRWKGKRSRDPLGVGTLKDLHKASKLFNFGYYVVGIDEHGTFNFLARLDKKNIIYLIARTNNNVITEWCALGDMRNYKDPSRSKVFTVPSSRPSWSLGHASSQSDLHRFLIEKRSKDSWRHVKFAPLRIRISEYFARLRLFIRRIKGRNKVCQDRFFPLDEIDNDVTSFQ